MILENMLVQAAIETVNAFIDGVEDKDKLHLFLDKFDKDTWNYGNVLKNCDIVSDNGVDLEDNIPETPYAFEDLRKNEATFITEQGEFKVLVTFNLDVDQDYPQFSDTLLCNLVIEDENNDYIAGPWIVYLTLQDNRHNECRFTSSFPRKPKFSSFAFKDDFNEDYDPLEMQAKLDAFEAEGDYDSYYDENEAYEGLKHVFYNAYLDNEKWLQAIWTDKGKYAHGFLTFKFDTYDALGINNVRGMPLRNGDYIAENDKYPEVIASAYCQKDLEKLLIDALFLARESEFDSLDNVVILFPTKSSTDLKDNHATLTCEGPIKIVSLETGDIIVDDIFEVFDQGNRKNLQLMDPEGYEAGDYDADIKIAKDVQKVMKLDISTEGKFNESKAQAIKSYKERTKSQAIKSYKEDKKLTRHEQDALKVATTVIEKMAKPYSKYLPIPKIEEYDNGYSDWCFEVTFEDCEPSEEYDDYNLETVDIVVYTNLSLYSDGYILIGDNEKRKFSWNGGDVRGEHSKLPVVKKASSRSPDELEKELADFDENFHEKITTRKIRRNARKARKFHGDSVGY